MPIQPTQVFIEVNGVDFPLVDTLSPPVDDVIFGADTGQNMKIYDYGILPYPDWRTPTASELIDNIPQYVYPNEKQFYVTSTNTLIPIIHSFKLINQEVLKLEYAGFAYYPDNIVKAFDDDTISAATGNEFLPNTKYLITLK